MSSLPAVLRNSTVLLAGTAAQKALVFVSTLVLVRSLGAEGFGLYSLVFAYLAFFEMLPDAGLDPLVVREATRSPEGRERILGDALLLRLLMGAVALPAALVGVRWLTDDPRGVLLVALGGLTWISSFRRTSLRSLMDIPYRLSLRMETPALLGFLAEAAHLGLLVLVLAETGVAGAVAVLGVAHLPFAAVLAARSARRLRPVLRFDRERIGALLRRTSPLLALLVANVVLSRIDVLMLELMRGPREVGLYAAPVRLVEAANLLPMLLMTSIYPLLTAAWPAKPAKVDRIFRVSLRFLSVVIVPVVVLEILYAEPLVRLFFGDGYAGSVAVLPVLAVAEVLIYTDIVFNARFLATGHERRNLHLVLVAALTNVAANGLLIPTRGAVGAAEATLIAYVVRVVAALVPRETRGAARSALRAILPASVAGLVALTTAWRVGPGGPAGVAAAAVAYLVVLGLLRGLRPSDFREILRAVRRRDR